MALSIQTAPIKYKDPTTGNFVEIVGVQGPAGAAGSGIASIAKTSTSGLVDTYTITFDNNNTTTFTVTNGSSISTIEKTNTSGLVDTYTVTLSNGNTSTFTVVNGQTPNISMGTVTEGATAAASFSGTASNLALNLTLPQADTSHIIEVQDTQPTNSTTKLWFKETQDDGVSVPTVSEMETALAGKVGDVQVNSVSVVSNGTANIPIATSSVFGAVKLGDSFSTDSSSKIILARASDAQVKAGTNNSNALVPLTQHHSVFYGLAKAAGDTTQSASSNAVGTYTDSAKNAIHTMLGTADLIEVGFVETVTGSTPSITGKANYRYMCGEVSTLSITPPSAGSIDVVFSSGSTATTLTVPNTVKWPAWFDATSLEVNTTYELLITDGTYGSVMLWAT